MIDKQTEFAGRDFLAIFDAGREASLILDPGGRILLANRTARQRLADDGNELIHRNLAELAAEGQGNDEPDKLQNLLKSGSGFEWRLRGRGGRILPVEVISQPIVLQGRPVFYLTLRESASKEDCEQVLSEQQRLLERIVETEPGTVYIFDLIEQKNIYVNCHWLDAFGYTAEETAAMGSELYKIFYPDDLQRISEHHAAWSDAADDEIRSLEYRVRDKQGNWHWLLSRETPFIRDESGRVCQILGIAQDISERKSSESLLGIQNRILNLIAAGTPLVEVLTTLVKLIETQCEGMLGSILLLDADGIHVRHGAAPSLPPGFVTAIDGQPIGPVAGSCGTAAYRKQPVYVEDINSDPLWENYKDVALAHGLQACWSTPVFDSGGQVLGTFAMYYRNPGLPTAYHLEIINTVTHIAAIAISRFREEQALRSSEHRFATLFGKSLVPGVLVRCSDSAIVDANEAWQQLFGYTLEEVIGKTSKDLNINRDHEPLLQNSSPVVPPVSVRNREQTLYNKSGKAISVITNINVVDIDGQDYAITKMLDITERKLAEAKIQRLTQLYATLSQCNQAIVRCHSEEELLPQICRDAVTFGGMKMAWIGMIEEHSNLVKPLAWFGEGTDYLETIDIILDRNNPKGQGPTASAILNDSPFWCQDFINDPATSPWHERGRRYGWGASASLPLHSRGKVVGAFNLYSELPYVFDEAEQNLLIEMSADISFALDRFASEKEHRLTDAALKASEQHLRTIVETEPDSVQVLDSDCRLLEMNAAGLKMLEIDSIDEIINRSLLDFIVPEYHHDFQMLHQHIMSGESDSLEFEIVGKQGTRRWLGTHAAPMRDANGNITAVLAITRDISEQKRAEERIQYLANFDSLTGLPNRIQLEDHIKYAISLMKRSNGHLAVLFIDIDRFKDINDTLGHSIGDALLVIIAQRIKSQLREEDTASRMGGDEFIVVLPECDAKGAAKVAQTLLQVIAEPYQVDSYELVVSASIGIAVFPEDGEDLESLSKSADTAMYRAKNEGRDGYRFFTTEMQEGARRNMLLVNALRHALERDQFQVVYQPQVSISEHRIIGVEALLRWRHPDLGQVSPGVFIPVAEDSRLILSIGEWVLRTAVKQLKWWLDKGYDPLVMAVNLSAVQFRHSGLPDSVNNIIAEAGIAPEFLELELTEGVAMQDAQGVLAMMNQLTQKGVRMSIDDFGTGYSSLSYLKKYRAYKLKIDQSFVRDITTDAEDKAIVAAIISMAKNLGLATIAEGVETLEQLNYLREQGCDEVQGYYFSRPLPAAEIEPLIAAVRLDPTDA